MENITDEFLNTFINEKINTKIRNSVTGKQLTVNRRNKTKLRKHFEQLESNRLNILNANKAIKEKKEFAEAKRKGGEIFKNLKLTIQRRNEERRLQRREQAKEQRKVREQEREYNLKRYDTRINQFGEFQSIDIDNLFNNRVQNIKIVLEEDQRINFMLVSDHRYKIIQTIRNYVNYLISNKERELGHTNIGYRVKLNFESGDGQYKKNIVVSQTHLQKGDWKGAIDHLISTLPPQATETKADENNDYLLRLVSFEVILFDNGASGGCADRECVDSIKKYNYTIKLKSVKSKHNNCLINCFLNFLGNKKYAKVVRKELGLEEGTKIHYKMIPKIADYFDCGYTLINCEGEEIVSPYNTEKENIVNLCLMFDHYYLVEGEIEYKKCEGCGRKLLAKNDTHTCNVNIENYYHNKVLKEGKYVAIKNIKDKKQYDTNYIICYDFETYKSPSGQLKPYAVGWKTIGVDNLKIEYSSGEGTFYNKPTENCVEKFVQYLLNDVKEGRYNEKSKCTEVVITAYNGSRFDCYLIMEELKRQKVKIEDLLNQSGQLLKFSFTNKNGIKIMPFDLVRFLMCSLNSACKDFDIVNAKTEFDHNKMINWNAIKEHKNECVEYLKMDVLALEELYVKVANTFYEKFQINLTNYMTTSHLSYSIWSSTLKENVSLPKDWNEYEFIRKSIYGGRTCPLQKKYQSRHFTEVQRIDSDLSLSKEEKQEKIKKIYKEATENTYDYLFNSDVSSLYPASMVGHYYPVGEQRWSENPKEDFKKGLLGIFNIKFIANPKIIVAPFPTKSDDGRLEWDVKDGEGNFNSVDIQNAIDLGYKVEFLEKAIVWDNKAFIFDEYLKQIFEWKEYATEHNLPVQRSLAKLLMNSIYGKMLQKAITETTDFINSFEEMIKFLNNYDLKDWCVFGENSLLLTGSCIEENREKRITKPCQIGSFVLGYSRQTMLNYMKLISPKLETHPMTYTDTDSLHITGKAHKKLREMGGILGSSLGKLNNDIKKDGIIIKEVNLAPKLYCYWYINKDGEFKITNKAKGICAIDPLTKEPTGLNAELFENEESKVIEWNSIKKIHRKVASTDKENFDHFTLKGITMKRTFLNCRWEGMNLVGNKFYPKHYQGQDALTIIL